MVSQTLRCKTGLLLFTLAAISGVLVLVYNRTLNARVISNGVPRAQLIFNAENRDFASIWTKSYLRHNVIGRLGNVLFQYASIYCIAKKNNLHPLLNDVPEVSFLQNPDLVVPGSVYNQNLSDLVYYSEKRCCSFDDTLQNLPEGRNYSLYGYLQSWKYFEPCKDDVKRILTFKDEYVREADETLRDLRKKFRTQTLVGVHIRMEDHTLSRAVHAGKRIATPAYFRKAMTYFQNRFHDVIFIVITSSQWWWLDNVTSSPDVTFLKRSNPATDMEILSRLDHLIISVGTFGWWVAYKSKGTVVCFNDFFTPSTHYASQFLHNATDYFYPGWIRM